MVIIIHPEERTEIAKEPAMTRSTNPNEIQKASIISIFFPMNV